MLKNLDNYKQLDPIGNGGYGKVYVAEENQTGDRFAVKFLRLLHKYHTDEAFQEEVSKLKSVNHLCLKKIEGCVTENQSEMQPEQLPGIITAFETSGTLDKEIKEESSASWLNLANQVVFLFAVASALNKLHEKKIYHGDLKPANIFVSKDVENDRNHGFYLPLIGDYGLASISEAEEAVSQSAFRAPELINGFIPKSQDNEAVNNEADSQETIEPNEKTDAFSFGMLVFYIFVKKFPRGKNAKPLLQGFRPDIPKSIPHGIRKVLSQCWDNDPSQRPSMKTVMKMLIESRVDLEFPDVGEFMYEIEPQLYSLTQISLLHHDNLKARVLMSEKENALNQKIESLQVENQELKNQLKKLKDFEELSKSQIDEVKTQIDNNNNSEIYQEIKNAKEEAVNEAVNQSFEKFTEQLRDKHLRRTLLYPQVVKKQTARKVKKKVPKNVSDPQNEGFDELTRDDDEYDYIYEYEEEEEDYDEDLMSPQNKMLLKRMSQDLESIKIKQDEAERAVQQIGNVFNADNEDQISNLNKAVDILSEKVENANGAVTEIKTTFIPSFNSFQTDYGKIKAEIDDKFSQLEKSLNDITNSYQEVNNHINQLHDNVDSFASSSKTKSAQPNTQRAGTTYLGDVVNFELLSDVDQNVVKIIEDFNQRLNKIEMMMNLQSEEVSSCLARLNLLSGANLSNAQKKLSEIENLVGKITIHKDELEANLIRFGIPVKTDDVIYTNIAENDDYPERNSSRGSTSNSPPKNFNSPPKKDYSPNSSQKQIGRINLNSTDDESESKGEPVDQGELPREEVEKIENNELENNINDGTNDIETFDENGPNGYDEIENNQQISQDDQQVKEEEELQVQKEYGRHQDDEEFTLKPFEEFENDNE